MTYLPYIVDLLLLYFLFGYSLRRRFSSKRGRLRLQLHEYEHHFSSILRRDRDILPPARAAELGAEVARLCGLRKTGGLDDMQAALKALEDGRGEKLAPPRSAPRRREFMEMLVVVLALAFGVRALFLQPFKIPTGSMQPTMYGIHFVDTGATVLPPLPRRFFDYLHHSRRHVAAVVAKTGRLEVFSRAKPAIPFFPAVHLQIAGVRYRLPGTEEDVLKYANPKLRQFFFSRRDGRTPAPEFQAGESLAQGYLSLGDHLFVNRTGFSFSEPARGDIVVFLTKDIEAPDGQGFAGPFYIKRLVGMPGDTLRIENNRLQVMPAAGTEFRNLDGKDHPAFDRLYSFTGGYAGHVPDSRGSILSADGATFKIPPGHYFMLGDNTRNSRDSRFWGTVPRRNLIGRAAFVWWPLSEGWGRVDRRGREPGKPEIRIVTPPLS